MIDAPMWPRSLVSVAMPTFQPSLQRAEQAVGRHLDVGEEDLVELRPAGHLPQRADLDAGQAHVEEEERDALVLAARRDRCGP